MVMQARIRLKAAKERPSMTLRANPIGVRALCVCVAYNNERGLWIEQNRRGTRSPCTDA